MFVDRTTACEWCKYAHTELAKTQAKVKYFQECARVRMKSITLHEITHPHMHRHVVDFTLTVQRMRRAQRSPTHPKPRSVLKGLPAR